MDPLAARVEVVVVTLRFFHDSWCMRRPRRSGGACVQFGVVDFFDGHVQVATGLEGTAEVRDMAEQFFGDASIASMGGSMP